VKVANKLFANEQDNFNEIQTPILKVRGKTLIFGNSIYQIANIASLDLVDLSTTKPIPRYFLWLLLIGLALLFIPGNIKILGIAVLGVLGWLFYQYQQTKSRTRYGVRIGLNSGRGIIIGYNEMDFLVKMMLVLNNIMNSEEDRAVTFNFDQRQIDDKSITVGYMHGSNMVTGSVVGDVVSNV
jgi:Family of unknown function (DUF6232)